MRILYFATHPLLPLTSGNRLRDFYLSRELAKREDVTFVEFCEPGEELSRLLDDLPFEEVVSLSKPPGYRAWNLVRGLTGPTPLTVLNYFDSAAEMKLQALLNRQRFDTVQLEGVHLTPYLRVIAKVQHPPEILIDWQNIESELMERYSETAASWWTKMAGRRTAKLLHRLELRLLEKQKVHTVVSTREKQKLLKQRPEARIEVIPNGVDTQYFSPTLVAEKAIASPRVGQKRNLLFVGSMDYHANVDGVVWFAREIWPEIAAKNPDLEFVVVGRNPKSEIRALASERIRVTGTVDDVRPYYANAISVIVPLRVGSGTRLKILEAMAAGVPVVSTSLGAEGIDAVPNTHLFLADNPRTVIEVIQHILANPNHLGVVEAAREFVLQHFDWSQGGIRLLELHRELSKRQKDNAKRV